MTSHSRKYIPLWGFAFFLIFVAVFFFVSKEQYLLNKVVRKVDLRLLQFQRISDKLNESFKLHFSENSLVVYQHLKGQEEWKIYLRYSFPEEISSSLDNLEVIFHDGELASLSVGQGEKLLQPFVILFFYPKKNRTPQKGIIFYKKSGGWRVLKRKT